MWQALQWVERAAAASNPGWMTPRGTLRVKRYHTLLNKISVTGATKE
jgi:hypothetical protein